MIPAKRGYDPAFFAKLAPYMAAPVNAEGPWAQTGFFTEPWMAPSARRQDVESLSRAIAGWATSPPDWIGARVPAPGVEITA